MPKMTKEELARRKRELTAAARTSIAKSEVLQFRLEPDSILEIYEIASEKKLPVGTMLRQWVLERVDVERGSKMASKKKRA
jgi:hypothetical protein